VAIPKTTETTRFVVAKFNILNPLASPSTEVAISQLFHDLATSDDAAQLFPCCGKFIGASYAMPKIFLPEVIQAALNDLDPNFPEFHLNDQFNVFLMPSMTEELPVQTLATFIWNKRIKNNWSKLVKVALFKILLTIHNITTRYPGFRHNDLMAKNIVVGPIRNVPDNLQVDTLHELTSQGPRGHSIKNPYNIQCWIIDFGLASVHPCGDTSLNPRALNANYTLPLFHLGIGCRPHRCFDHQYLITTMAAAFIVQPKQYTGREQTFLNHFKQWVSSEYIGVGLHLQSEVHVPADSPLEAYQTECLNTRSHPSELAFLLSHAFRDGSQVMNILRTPEASHALPKFLPFIRDEKKALVQQCFEQNDLEALFFHEPSEERVWTIHRILQSPFFNDIRG